jgi:hypothetical protein
MFVNLATGSGSPKEYVRNTCFDSVTVACAMRSDVQQARARMTASTRIGDLSVRIEWNLLQDGFELQ